MSDHVTLQGAPNADIKRVTITTDDPEIGRALLLLYAQMLLANEGRKEVSDADRPDHTERA